MPDTSIGSIQHVDIPATEPAKLKQFLEQQFGWTFTTHKMPMGDYHLFKTPNGNGGGVSAPMPGMGASVTPYINVKDIQASLAGVQKAGAKIVLPVTDVEGQGKFFLFQVAGSPTLACWQQTGPRN